MKGLTLAAFLTIPPAWRPPLMVADGMGVDSTAMLLRLYQLGIRPDAILHADTGDEHPETVAYRETRAAWLRDIGFPELVIVRRAPSVQGNRKRRDGREGVSYATLGENCIENRTLPGLAFGFKSCSIKWKIEPQNAWTETWAPARRAWGHGQRVVKLIGYDNGPRDSRRAHELGDDDHYSYLYPLREWGWDRERCIEEIARAGVRVPRKSACFYCPFSTRGDFQTLAVELPERFAQTEELEDGCRTTKSGKVMRFGYLHGDGTDPALREWATKPYKPAKITCKVCGQEQRATKATGCGYLPESAA